MASVRKKKILILGNSHLVVFKFRGELISTLVERGYDVWVCFPNGPFGEGEQTAKIYGCHFIENKMERRGTNPIKDSNKIFFTCKDWNIADSRIVKIHQFKEKRNVLASLEPFDKCKEVDIPYLLNNLK